jgi:hypothetical protein
MLHKVFDNVLKILFCDKKRFSFSFLSFFLDKKGRKNQEQTIPTAQATGHRVCSSPTHRFINLIFLKSKLPIVLL